MPAKNLLAAETNGQQYFTETCHSEAQTRTSMQKFADRLGAPLREILDIINACTNTTLKIRAQKQNLKLVYSSTAKPCAPINRSSKGYKLSASTLCLIIWHATIAATNSFIK